MRSVAKDFYKLQKNINSFSNGEARVLSFDDELARFEVELNIKDGFYKDGIFVFDVILDGYPDAAPNVWFSSQIFHPNIGDGFEDREICLNLLSEDWSENDLEDVVHGVLFLVKNPNPDDAMNPYTASEDENFEVLVRQSLEGGEVVGTIFERNPGLVQQDKQAEQLDILNLTNSLEIDQKSTEATNSTTGCLANPNLTEDNLLPISTIKISSKDELYRSALYWVYNNFTDISTNGKLVCWQSGCPKWLASLAILMYGGTRNKKKSTNMLSRNLRNFQRFSILVRKLVFQK